MRLEINKTEQESRWLHRGSWAVLTVCLLGSAGMWWQASTQLQAEADRVFARQGDDLHARLGQQMDHYLGVLGSFQAMFLADTQVPRQTFHQHYQRLDLTREYPALRAVQYAPRVAHADKARFEAGVRADRSLSPDGYPAFRITPDGQREEYLPIAYNEPMAPNQIALGADVLARRDVQDTLVRARDSGLAQLSPPVALLQGQPGLVVRLPVYRAQSQPASVAARREALVGMVSGVFQLRELMSQAWPHNEWQPLRWTLTDTGPQAAQGQGPHLSLFDSVQLIPSSISHPDQAAPQDARRYTLNQGGRVWSLQISRAPVHAMLQPYPLALLLGGVVGAIGLWWALRSAASRHQKAAELAHALSRQAIDSEQRLRAVLDSTVDGIIAVASSGQIQGVNQAVCRIFGYTEAQLQDAHLSKLLPGANLRGTPQDVDTFLQLQHAGLEGLGRRTEGQRSDGQLFPLDLAVSHMEWAGQTQHICVLRDLSTQEATERAIMAAQRQLNEVDEMRRVIVHNAPYAIFVLNNQGTFQTVNPAGERLLGYAAHELIGRSTTQRFFEPEQVAERAHLLALRLNQPLADLNVLTHLAQESPGLPTEWTMVRSDSTHLVAEILVTELTDEFGSRSGFLVMAHDVTSRHEAEYQLQHMALHDALTSLPNRNMLQEQLKACLNIAEREQGHMAMMFLDLDRFKKINDSLGHHIGDSVLIEVARRLRSAMRSSDIVARLGGDEFVVLLPRITEPSDGALVSSKVLELFNEPIMVGAHELRVTPSVGVAMYPEHGTDAITLMRHADLAMYQAKSKGRNRVQVYSDTMLSPSADTLLLESDLYHALERDEFRLHYQPQFDCVSGQLTGAEALLRWEHGGRLIPPADFIPLAEETGLIVPIGEWVLRHACTLAHHWRQRTGLPLRMAVNLSAVQLDREDVADTVARVLQETGLAPTALELEITESVVVRESLRAADVLRQLRALGVGIAIDDFGVGYSSFAYLRELPVDRFKLDRSFLTGVPHSSGDSRLVAALIAMGHRLEVGIVAEGVENQAQADFLRDHGCDEAQGYHLGRPMKQSDFEALLLTHSPNRLSPEQAEPLRS